MFWGEMPDSGQALSLWAMQPEQLSSPEAGSGSWFFLHFDLTSFAKNQHFFSDLLQGAEHGDRILPQCAVGIFGKAKRQANRRQCLQIQRICCTDCKLQRKAIGWAQQGAIVHTIFCVIGFEHGNAPLPGIYQKSVVLRWKNDSPASARRSRCHLKNHPACTTWPGCGS